ncbi:heavy metal-responsive transcriptional regulator [Pseudomonas sp. 2FE]|uniref:heavy metal-responsive transcriptional regulator n=1 Tax=Pseudomonas sp. 2FE TaxID=2502190 RepID=UPI0010F5B357|nr:heavy metal-responsive transcriptional regulator [Pseudomonas sp. 2FE]
MAGSRQAAGSIHSAAAPGVLTIGKLATATGVSTDTLRYYEQMELIAPDGRSASGYRLYGLATSQRVRFVRQAQACGFSLPEIRQLLTLRADHAACCGGVRQLALEKKLRLEQKIRVMQEMSRALDQLIESCADETLTVDDCPILAALEQSRMQGSERHED